MNDTTITIANWHRFVSEAEFWVLWEERLIWSDGRPRAPATLIAARLARLRGSMDDRPR